MPYPAVPLAAEQFRRSFHSEGFAVPSGFSVPLDMLADVRRGADRKVGNVGLGVGHVEVRRLRRRIPAVAALVELCTPEANRLTGRSDMRCTFDEVIIGRPGGKEATTWHQDEAFTVVGRFGITRPDRSLTFWIPLQNVSEANGALRYLPQSHRHGLRSHKRGAGGRLFIPGVDGHEAQTITLEAGQCVVHHGLVVHRAHPNQTTVPRWAVGIQFRPGRRSLIEPRSARHDL